MLAIFTTAIFTSLIGITAAQDPCPGGIAYCCPTGTTLPDDSGLLAPLLSDKCKL